MHPEFLSLFHEGFEVPVGTYVVSPLYFMVFAGFQSGGQHGIRRAHGKD